MAANQIVYLCLLGIFIWSFLMNLSKTFDSANNLSLVDLNNTILENITHTILYYVKKFGNRSISVIGPIKNYVLKNVKDVLISNEKIIFQLIFFEGSFERFKRLSISNNIIIFACCFQTCAR
jgi:hypothetical protein